MAIWEFANNYRDMFLLEPFRPEELFASLHASLAHEVGLVRELFCSLIRMLMDELGREETSDEEELLQMVRNYADESVEQVWPTVLSILIRSERFFLECDESISKYPSRLNAATPDSFNLAFSFAEKLQLLHLVVLFAHDLPAFRLVMTNRLQERLFLRKQRIEILNGIKDAVRERTQLLREGHVTNEEKLEGQIDWGLEKL